MSQIEIADGGASLRDLIERAEAGEDVTFTREGRAVARIVAVESREGALPAKGRRRLGLAQGKWDLPDDFFAPLTEQELALFYDGPLFPEEQKPGR